jgi:hypothetical protein
MYLSSCDAVQDDESLNFVIVEAGFAANYAN